MRAVLGSCLVMFACGGDVRVTDDGTGAGGEAQGGGPLAGADAGGSDAGFSVWPGQTFSTINCNDDGPQLFIEIWPDSAKPDACVPSNAIDPAEVLVIAISGWDFTSGVFAMESTSIHGTAHAAFATGPETASGSLTLEPFGDVPGVISWDLDFAEGSTDLSLCFRPPEVPCATPD